MPVPSVRIRTTTSSGIRRSERYVVYWMTAFRRLHYNFALQHAVERANELGLPLVILEPLRVGYRWACDRFHRFILDGMHEHSLRILPDGVRYLAYVERRDGEGSGLLEALAGNAALVVADDYPAFFLRRMVPKAAARLSVQVDIVDANGIVPIHAADRTFTRAFSFRKHLDHHFNECFRTGPERDPLDALHAPHAPELPEALDRWKFSGSEELSRDAALEAALDIDHSIRVVADRGGTSAAVERWRQFLDNDLRGYADGRNHPDDDRSSRLSPWLHFGHISSYRILYDVADSEGWEPRLPGQRATSMGEVFAGLSAGSAGFLDQLITWREIGFNMCARASDFDEVTSLPSWALTTIEEHRRDPRDKLYSLDELANSQTDDDIWNAAQTQLRTEGRMHNYLRMLWGKRVLEWSVSVEEAIERLIELNNRYALDGRDPNSYSGIFWVFGRYDRAWGPERPIFGKLRYMTSGSTRKKLRLKQYLDKYGAGQQQLID